MCATLPGKFNALWVAITALVLSFCQPTQAQTAAQAQALTVTLAWDSSTDTNVVGYMLFYSVNGSNFNSHVDAGMQTQATVTGLKAGVTYYFEVATYDDDQNESSPSSPVIYTAPGGKRAVTVAASPSNGGTVTGGGSFAAGATVTVKATANSTHTFTNWTQNGIVQSSSPTYSFTLNSNENLVANFTLNPVIHTVSVSAWNNGSVSPSGVETVIAGNSLTFTATPASGYQVSQWLVNGSVAQTNGATYILADIYANATVLVTFAANPVVAVAANPAKAGSVMGGGSFAPGSTVTVTAVANSGYTFTNWTENGVVQTGLPSYTFIVAASRNLVANFTVNPSQFTVAASAGNNGSVTPSVPQTVTAGAAVAFVAAPASGYDVSQWLVGGVVAQNGGLNFTLSNIASNSVVSVSFAASPKVAVSANPPSAGNIAGAGVYSSGSSVTVSAVANTGYTFTNWTENGVVQSASPAYSFVISANRNLVANFTANTVTYSVTGLADTNGSVDPSGAQSVGKGGAVSFTATPTNGYQVNQWFVGGVAAQSGGTNFTLLNVTSNTTVEVNFTLEPIVTVAASSTSAGTVSGGGSFAAGSTVTVTAAANDGYTFANWTDNGVVQSVTPAYSFVISGNRNLVAHFTANQIYYTVTAGAISNGVVAPGASQTVAAGGSIVFTATPNNGYQVGQWLVGGVAVQTGGLTYTLSDVSSNIGVSVNFAANPMVTVAVNLPNAGVVTGGGVYAPGSSVTVTATANSGYAFTNWTENGIVQSASPVYTFVASANRTLVANFAAIVTTYMVTGRADTNGSIDPAGSQSVGKGSVVSFTATPTNGYQVDQWFVGGLVAQIGGTNFALLNVSSNTTVEVNFVAEPTVAVAADSIYAGTVTGSGAFIAGSAVTVTATANSGYTFTNWTENGVVQSILPNYTFIISANRNLVANFTVNPVFYSVTASAGNNGSINPVGLQNVLEGSAVVFTATPNSGYQIGQWLVGGVLAQTGGSTFTLSDVSSNTAVTVNFAANPTVTVVANPASAGVVTGGGAYAPGSSVTVTATANSAYTFTSWTENGAVQSTSASYGFVVSANRNLVANFTIKPVLYTVTSVADTNGSVDPSGAQTVTNGGSASFIATPTNGYLVNEWLVGGILAQIGGTNFALLNVTSNTTVEVKFVAEPTVVVAASSTNAGTVTGGGVYAPGSTVTVTATAKSGYTFTNWTENGVVQSTSASYAFVISDNRNLVGNFAANPVFYSVTASAGNNGSVSPVGLQTALEGSAVIFTAAPNDGYQVGQWLVGGVAVQTGGLIYTLSDVSSNTGVSVNFTANPTVAVIASPANAGVVTGGGVYAPGSSVTVTATANSGYTFTNWTENGVIQSASPSYNFLVTGNRSLMANFTANITTYTVTGLADTNGAIDPAGSQTVSKSSVVSFTATPTNGYQVDQWFVGGLVAQIGGTNFALLNVNSNTTVEVNFVAEPTVAVAADSIYAGTVTGGGAFIAGSAVTVTATANSGYTFTNWTENGVVQSILPNYTFIISANRNLVANFTVNPVFYSVTASAGNNGSINPVGLQNVLEGSAVVFTATPNSGYQIGQWLVGGVLAQTGGSTFTLSDVSSNTAVTVNFAANPMVTVVANPASAGVVTGGGAYAPGSSVTVTATANSAYTFTSWTENGAVQSVSSSYGFVVSANRNLVANFTIKPVLYTVTSVADTNGSVDPSGAQTVTNGGSASFIATPTNGYLVNAWLVGGILAQSGGTNFALLNVTSNTTVEVKFVAEPTVVVAASSTNAGTVTGGGVYAPGSTVTVTATAKSGYTFTNWTENGVVQSTSASYGFVISDNRNLVANFTANQILYTVWAAADANGNVKPGAAQSVMAGGSALFTAMPDDGYQIDVWWVGGVVAQTGGATLELTDITSNTVVIVSFVANPAVAVAANPARAGSVSGGGSFDPGSTVTVTATANSGYMFTNWTENGVVQSASPNYSFELSGNRNLVANFTAKPVLYTVTAMADTNGSVDPNGAQSVTKGGSLTFTATATNEYQVDQWLVGGMVAQTGGTNYTLSNVRSNTTVEVNFVAEPVVYVEANLTNGGVVTGGGAFMAGSTVTVTASVNNGYTFANWTEDGVVVSASPAFTFVISDDRDLVANYVLIPVYYSVTASSDDNGSVSPGAQQTALAGSSVIFNAIPNSGYQVNQWLVDGELAQTGGSTFTLMDVSSNTAVAVTFAADPAVAVTINPAGAGVVAGGGVYAPGSFATVTASVNNGYTFTNWTENGVVQSDSPSYTFVVSDNRNLVANYIANPVSYTVTIGRGTNGSVSPGAPQIVTSGAALTFTATPASGYQVNQWFVGGIPAQMGGLVYTLPNVTSNTFVAATFDEVALADVTNFTVLIKGNGTLSGYRAGQAIHTGRRYSIAAIPGKGSLFADWSSNGVMVTTAPTYSFIAESNLLLQAEFVTNPFIPVDGAYSGLFYDTNDITEGNSGSFAGTVTSVGGYSARIAVGGLVYAHSGKFSLTGAASFSILRGKSNPLIVQLQLDLANGPMTGTVSDGNWTASLVAERATYTATYRAPEAGRYTMVIPGNSDPTAGPAGNGFAALSVDIYGHVSLSGMLGDGVPINATSIVGSDGEWPLYISLNGGRESILGWLNFNPDGTMGGQVAWIRVPQPTSKLYPAGFTSITGVVGSTYRVFKGVAPFNITSDMISLNGGNLSQSLGVQLGMAARILGVSASYDRLIFTPATGLFTVLVMNPLTDKSVTVHGVVLQNQNYGAGLFLGVSQSGGAILSPGQ